MNWPDGLRLKRENLASDLVAGATFAIVNVPQGMANAVLASVNPVAGLYALMVAMPVGAVFTSSIYMNVSTTGALSVAAGEALYGFAEADKIGALVTLVLLVGAFQLVFGLLRLGKLIRFVSNAVMTGFISGIAFLIMFGSVSDITGYSSTQPNHILRLADTMLRWRLIDLQTVLVGLSTVGLILAFQRTALRRFALILALAVATLLAMGLVALMGGQTAVLVRDIAVIPRSLPLPILPDLASLGTLALPAFAIAVIGLIQGAGVGQSYPNPDGRFPDTSRDFVGQGAANLAAGAFGAIPCGGSMSGTAVNYQAGAKSRWSNIFAGVFVILIVLLLVDLVKIVPMAALGGLLLVVGYQNLQPEAIRTVWATGLTARAAMAVTFAATLFLPLQFAILIGVALSFLLQILHMSNRVEVREFELVENGFPIERPVRPDLGPGEVRVLRARGSLFFASAQGLEAQLPKVAGAAQSTLIFILRDVDDLGSTVIRLLTRYAKSLRAAGGTLVLTGVNEELYGQLERTGLLEAIGAAHVYRESPELGAALNQAIAEAQARLPHGTEA
ncbi:SulP family inorganic anion transporter [Pseudoruegeria sp. SHC-113]|uniref:SulP family inorganic anion transporter n=1 Tax=Pseudoruegeria sp. SHC-113 TaxID=2855439 RepID=UPI0021BB22F3|nr:solute carrier family 23 protein [Pseudoruegeria sp. SHC-113]MCT8162128.1 STAS domain-containing protein [Pseudoruegeria sp. SHC-113]